MIITKTPFRLSFFGGGTDLPDWFNKHGGSVLSAAIDKFCWVSVRRLPPFFEHRHRVVYSKVDAAKSIAEIGHPAVRAALQRLGFGDAYGNGLEIHHDGDLPARSGIGSSSSFSVGLLNALHTLRGRACSPRELATEAIALERLDLNEAGGWQDQVAAAHGGLNRIDFAGGGYDVFPIVSREAADALEERVLLFWTGIPRASSEVQASWAGDIDERRALLLEWSRLSVETAVRLLVAHDLDGVGQLLREAWARKRELSARVSTYEADNMIADALRAGAHGAKLTGAGGGGFLLALAPVEAQAAVRKSLSKFLEVPVRFCPDGSRVVVFQP